MKVSIIIPCRLMQDSTDCFLSCYHQSHKDIQILVIDDDICPGLPSTKRDYGLKLARGEVIAFIDSDAYPDKDWIKNALNHMHFRAGVCGPGLLPPNSTIREKAADLILRCMPFSERVAKRHPRDVDDWPTFNLIIRKKIIDEVGGFNCNFLTGEDTLLCKKIIDKGYMIRYSPCVVVYHRRRSLFKPFLRQIATYATHRGHFFRKGIGKRKWVYALPSMVLLASFLLLLLMLFSL